MQTRARKTVMKVDGSVEDYLHTKVLATINNCMTQAGYFDIQQAEEFAQVITYYLYKEKIHTIRSGQILALVKEVLCSTGFEDAAEALSSYQLRRAMRRGRIEVVSDDKKGLYKIKGLYKDERKINGRWNKSRIVSDLVEEDGLERQLARTIAGAVEEKILGLQLRQVSTKLVKQIVLAETGAMLHANKQLQNV